MHHFIPLVFLVKSQIAVLDSVNLTNFSFPFQGKESVFVFTPINFGGPEEKKKANFQWVANDVAEVCLTLYNPLPVCTFSR